MKISEAIIQSRNIEINTPATFFATYKGKQIIISRDHRFNQAKWPHLTRYFIDVIDIKTGLRDVGTYEDCRCMKDAIRYALQGARLISISK